MTGFYGPLTVVSTSLVTMSDDRLGPWLRDELRRREWSIADLARRANLDASAVGRWVRSDRTPSPESCDLLADALGVDVDRVLVLAGHRPDIEAIPVDDTHATIQALLRQVDLTPDRAYTVIGMLRMWLDLDRRQP